MLYDQIESPIKNDWLSETKNNLQELGLDHYSLEDIKKIKLGKYKKLVKDACKDKAFMNFTNEIKTKNIKKY